MSHTVRIHRILKAPPQRAYKAFVDADALAKWLPPFGFTGSVQHMDPTEGGGYRMSFSNFGTGQAHSFAVQYIQLKPHELLHYTQRFDDPHLPETVSVSVSLRPVLCGTELTVVQDNLPAVIPLELCYLGWQESLLQLAHLVEPWIPAHG